MFPLSNGRLIRINKDGSDGEIISSKKTSMVFGTSVLNDYYIHDADPKLNIHCEIATDEYGRVSITNKSSNEIFVNDKSITSMRPLFNDSIIKVCNEIQFRWQYKQAKENICADLNEADFASWSDPAKKNNKQSKLTKKQKQKGRLTAHPLHIFSQKNMESQSVDSLNENVCTTVSSAVIDGEPAIQSDTTNQSEVTKTTEIQTATVPFAETDISIVKSQISNCSIITVSSDGGRDDTVDTANESKDESIEIFDHTILPSSQESQNDVSKCDPATEISLLATPVTSGGKRVVSTDCEFNATNLIDFDLTMNITNTKDKNNSASLTPCPSASIIPEKNDERIEAMINTESLFEDSDLIEIDDDKENAPIESTEADNDITIEIVSNAGEDEDTNGAKEHPNEISSSPILIESVSQSQEKVQLEAVCDDSIEHVGENSCEYDGNEGKNKCLVLNGNSEKDESFIPEKQFETSIDFEYEGSSVDNEKIELKTHTESVSQIENVKSFTSDAIECNDLISLSEKQDGSLESHELLDNGSVQKAEVECTTEALSQTEIVLAENAEDQIIDTENAQIPSTEAKSDTTIDNDFNLKEQERKGGDQEQPEEILSSHSSNEGESEAAEIETEGNETTEIESHLVPSGEIAEDLKALDADDLTEEVGEPSLTDNANESVIEILATNGTSKGNESFVPETQFKATNDFEMESDNFTSVCNDSILLPRIGENGTGANREIALVDEIITETSDQIENEETESVDLNILSVYEKQAGTYEDTAGTQEIVPIELTEAENDRAIQKDLNVEEEKTTLGDQEVSSSHILNEEISEAQQSEQIEAECKEAAEIESHLVASVEIAEVSNGFDADKSVECSITNGTTEKDESFIPDTQCDTASDFKMEINNEETEPNVSQIDNQELIVIKCDDPIIMHESQEIVDNNSSAPKIEDEIIAKTISHMETAESVDVNYESVNNAEEKIQEVVVRLENEGMSNGAVEDTQSLPVITDEEIVNNDLVADVTAHKTGEGSNVQISNGIELERPIGESDFVAETQDDTFEECEMVNKSQSDEGLVEHDGKGESEPKSNESLSDAELDVSTIVALGSEVSYVAENNAEEASIAVDNEIISSTNEDMHSEDLDNDTQNKLKDSFLDTSSHYAKTESSAVSSMFNDSAQMTEGMIANYSLSKTDTSKESGLDRSDDEFDMPTSAEKEPMKAIDSPITELNQIIANNQSHLNSIIVDQVLDTSEHIPSTDNADVETKSENENISIDVRDFEFKSTSEKVLNQGNASIGESTFSLDNFLNSQQTTIQEPSIKPEMSMIDADKALISTPSNTQTANDSESYNLCDFSIESEPSLIAQHIASTLDATNESTIKQENDSSISGSNDQIEHKLIDVVDDQTKENDKEMVCDYIEENSKPANEVSANDKTTEKLLNLISVINVEKNDENVTNSPNSASEELKTSESNESDTCETGIEVENLEPAIEEINESFEVDASIISSGNIAGTDRVDEDLEHLVLSDAVTADQTSIEVESPATIIPEIVTITSILDNVDGKDNESDSDQFINGETASCIQEISNVVEKLEIFTSEHIKSSDQVVAEPTSDVITCPPANKIEIDFATTQMNDDILEVKNDAIEFDQEGSASSDQNVSTSSVTIPVKRSISEATTVSRTISDEFDIKVELTPVKVNKPSIRSTVIDNSIDEMSTKAYDHHFVPMNSPFVNTEYCNFVALSAKKATRNTLKETSVTTDFEQFIETNLLEKHSSIINVCSEQKPSTKECKMTPNTPLVNKTLKNVAEKPSPRRTRSASKSYKSNENGANVDLVSIQKDIMKDVNVEFDIQKQLETPASKPLEETEPSSSSKRNRKHDSDIKMPNSSSSDISETPEKRSTDDAKPEVALQTPLINKHLQIGGWRSSARRNVRSVKETEEKEHINKANESTTDIRTMTSNEQSESEPAQQMPMANKTLQAVEPRSSTRRNVKTAISTKKVDESEFNYESNLALIDTPKVRSSDKVEHEIAPNTPVTNKYVQAVEPRSSTRRNVKTAVSTKKVDENEFVNKSNLGIIDTPKDLSGDNTESEVATQTPAANKNSQLVEPRSSTRRNVRSVFATKVSDEKELNDKAISTTIDTPKVPSSEQTEPENALQTPLVNKHLQIGGSRSSARRNIRSTYVAKESEEKELDGKASVSINNTETEVTPQTAVANKNSQLAEPRSSTRRNVSSAYATKVSDDKELIDKSISTTIDTPKMQSNDDVGTSVKRSTRINKKDNQLALAAGEGHTQYETPKKASDEKSITVRIPATFEPEALSTPVLKDSQEFEARFSGKHDNSSTPRVELAKRSTNDKNRHVEAADIPTTPLVNKNLRLAGTRSSAKRGRTAHDDVVGSASKSFKLDTTEFKIDVQTVGKDSITEQITPVINKPIRVVELRSSTRRNVKSIYATKVIDQSASNIDLSCAEKELDILKTATNKLNDPATPAINETKMGTASELNIGEDPINSLLGLSEMLKTPVVKKTRRKNATKQKAVSKLAEPKNNTITGNLDVDDSINNSFGLTEMLKTPAVKYAYGQIDSRSCVRNAKSNNNSTNKPLKSESDLSSPEKISEMLKSPIAYTSSLIANPGSLTNNSKMVMLPNTTPNKKPIQMVSNFVSTPSTSGISPNKATSIRLSGQKTVKALTRNVGVRTSQSPNINIGQSPVKPQISPSIKGQTPVQMRNTSSSSFVPYLRSPQNPFVSQSPGTSYSFSSTNTPNNMVKVGKTYASSGTPIQITQSSFANQSPAKTSNTFNSSFELPKTPMIVKTPIKSVTERKSFTGADGLYYRSPAKGGPNTISPMNLTPRPNFTSNVTINSVSPKIQVVQHQMSTPNTTPTMNKMLPVQFTSQPTSARCLKIDFGSQMEKHQNQGFRNTPNTNQANSSNMMSSTPHLLDPLLPSRISQSYMNATQVSMQKGTSTMMANPKLLNSQLMPQSSNSYDQYQFFQVLNTSSAQQNVTTRRNITKQSPSINDVKQAFDIQSPAMQTTSIPQTKRPAKRRGKQIDMPTESANEMPVQRAIETETNPRVKRAKTASVGMYSDQASASASFIPTGASNERNMNSAAIQPQIDEKPKRGKRKASKDENPKEAEEIESAPISQGYEMNTNSAAMQPQIDEKPKRGKRKASKDEKPTEVKEVKPKRGRQKKNEKVESSSSVAMVQELSPIAEVQVKPKRAGRRQNSATKTANVEPCGSVEMTYHLQEASQEPAKAKRGGRRQNSATETVIVEPIQEVIEEKPGRRVLRTRTIDEAPPAPEMAKPIEMAKTTRSKRNVVEPIIKVEEPVVSEKPIRGRRKAVQIEIPSVPEFIEGNVEVKTTRSMRRPTVDDDMSVAQSSINVKNGNQKKVHFKDETPTNGSTHETFIKLDIEPDNAEKKTTRKRTLKSKVAESDEAAYEAPRTRRGRKPKIEAVQETAEETKMALTRPRRAAKKTTS